jgi:hypothetical protein
MNNLNSQMINGQIINKEEYLGVANNNEEKIKFLIENINFISKNYPEYNIDDTSISNINKIEELLKHINIHISSLPICKYKSKTYAISAQDILTIDEIKSIINNNVVIIFSPINNSLDKFRAIVIK